MPNEVSNCVACGQEFAPNFNFCPACGEKSFVPVGAVAPVYRVTLVREKNVRQRNLLLLGAVASMLAFALAGVVYSIFNKPLDVAAVETGELYSFVADIDPVTFDPAEELEKSRKKRGGGGGGRNDREPAQKGAAATQVDDPLFSPSKDYTRLTDPELKIRAATKGNKQAPVTDQPYGLSGGGDIPSDGQGCCGGQGNSRLGRGQVDDKGDGLGPGKDGGPGGGGTGPDGGDPFDKLQPVVKVVRVTQAVKILSKPRANYTDKARLDMIQGKVVLKVTFLASGAIGQVTVVSGLPGGLTEQAVAAARTIRFEPAMVDGKAVSVTKTIEYNFAIF